MQKLAPAHWSECCQLCGQLVEALHKRRLYGALTGLINPVDAIRVCARCERHLPPERDARDDPH